MRNRLFFLAKIAVSVSIVFVICARFETNEFSRKSFNYSFVLIALFFALIAVPLVAVRWRLLAKIFCFNISMPAATRATFVGLFIGQVLPGGIGADVARGWMLWNAGVHNILIVASLVLDRLISLMAIIFMSTFSIFMLIPYLHQNTVKFIFFVSSVFFLVLSIIWYFFREVSVYKFKKIISWLLKKLSITNIAVSTKSVLYALGLGVLGHLAMIFSAYFLSLSIGINTSFWMWLSIMPIIIFLTAIPISINGWGVREFSMIYLWGLFGVPESDAFLTSICVGLVAILSSLPGFLFWFQRKRNLFVHIESAPTSTREFVRSEK